MLPSTSKFSFVLLLLLFAISFHSSISINNAEEIRCNEKDRQILSIFRQGIVDPSNRLSSWSSEEDCCSWLGVHCDNITGRVTELHLPDYYAYDPYRSKALRGEINLSVLQLEFLNYLDLSLNQFETIHIPPINGSTADSQIHNHFSNLHYLYLSDNSDRLRMDNLHWLSSVSSIKYLDLSGIDLQMETNWLQSISILPSLSELRLSGCQLNKAGSPLGRYVNFPSLKVLDLSDNNLGFEVLRWASVLNGNLSDLILRGNLLKGHIPDTLLKFQHLETLDLSNNELNESILDWLGHFKYLKYLNLFNNSLSGVRPSSLTNLSSLVELDLGSNHFKGLIPDWLGQFKYLEHLDLANNSFHGVMPSSLQNLSSLVGLYLSSNHFKGLIPDWLGQFKYLEYLDLAYNSFHGVMPSSLKNLSSLVGLYLSSNHFKGLIPDWLGQFKYLEYLDLAYNSFYSPIPATLGNLSSLTSLDLRSNHFSSLPANFWKFAATIKEEIDISNNLITEDISNIWLNTSYLWLKDNNFSGVLPHLSPNVRFLDVSNNIFSSISSLLCHGMTEDNNLNVLDASYNQLLGEIPDCWSGWKSLAYLSLDSNGLTGTIPNSMSLLFNLQLLDLSNNKFFGEIPILLQNKKNLLILNLMGNNFSGSIPSWIGQKMNILALRSNQFSGTIPSHICQISSLIILDLADNKLSGSIPDCLSNITAMKSVKDIDDHKFIIHVDNAISLEMSEYDEQVILFTKGRNLEYGYSQRLVRFLDLSSNELSGIVPLGLFGLQALHFMNLSRNQLTGKLPVEMGNMTNLESLDLSWNKLCGQIPQSISSLSFLSILNLSYNHFFGQIPLGTQLQSFEKYSYIGNPNLCGAPLPTSCNNVRKPSGKEPFEEDNNESDMFPGFYIAMEVGFVTGFLGVCLPILFKRSCRHAYFKFVDDMKDGLYVTWVLKMKSFKCKSCH